jgi:DNA-binding NarL/FixJ family response regulator
VRVCALVSDLMDRSKISAALPDVAFTLDGNAEVVIVDLARNAQMIPEIRAEYPAVRIVGFGPHVDDDTAAYALSAGADVVLPRSRFFRDLAAALAGRSVPREGTERPMNLRARATPGRGGCGRGCG